jgi:hypothetical protein
MNTGLIYLIQPSELVGTERYKIGMSNNSDLVRCKNGYKKGSRYICIMECIDPLILEEHIKKLFNENFKLIAGKEYYEGNETEMLNKFITLVNEYKKDMNNREIYNKSIVKNNYQDKIIISKDILIKKDDTDETDIFHETLQNVFLKITQFYKQNISLSIKNITNYNIENLSDDTLKLYNNTINEIKIELLEEENCIDIINYITLYKYTIIDTINLHFYDNNKEVYDDCIKSGKNWHSNNSLCYYTQAICDFLGQYNNNYSFLTSEYLYNVIKYNCEKYGYYEIIKEKNNKYSGIVLHNKNLFRFISNIDLDYNYINKYGNFFDNCQKYRNDHESIIEHLEGYLDMWDFNNISYYSSTDDSEFKKIIYSQIIKLSIKNEFSEKILSCIQNNKNVFEQYKDKKIMKTISKYKNLQLFIKNNL